MAVRRGVGIVLVLIVAAVAVSAAGLVLMAALVGRQPQVAGNSTLVLQDWRRPARRSSRAA